jgi:hypothetical protein
MPMRDISKETSVKEIAALIRKGAERLLKQTNYSADYLLDEGSEIAEANVVVHLASEFIADGHAVWAEAPLKRRVGKRGRFDLSIDLDYEHSLRIKSLKIEAKRIAEFEESGKVREIINDFGRMKSWRGHPPKKSKFPESSNDFTVQL